MCNHHGVGMDVYMVHNDATCHEPIWARHISLFFPVILSTYLLWKKHEPSWKGFGRKGTQPNNQNTFSESHPNFWQLATHIVMLVNSNFFSMFGEWESEMCQRTEKN